MITFHRPAGISCNWRAGHQPCLFHDVALVRRQYAPNEFLVINSCPGASASTRFAASGKAMRPVRSSRTASMNSSVTQQCEIFNCPAAFSRLARMKSGVRMAHIEGAHLPHGARGDYTGETPSCRNIH